MTTYELEIGNKELNINIHDNGDMGIIIYQKRYGWNDGNKTTDIIIRNAHAKEVLAFLERYLIPAVEDMDYSPPKDNRVRCPECGVLGGHLSNCPYLY